MDVEKKIQQLQTIHPFILLEEEPNMQGDYLFFKKCDFNPVLDYHFEIYIVRNDLKLETIKELQEIINKLLAQPDLYFKVVKMNPIKLDNFFMSYCIDVVVGEYFDNETDFKG